jgi:16S rRNA (guanine527-N7)-methyltransferase
LTGVSRETRARLDRLRELVIAENEIQNLVSPSSIAHFEERHIVDSMQLAALIPAGTLVDIGTGAGFPGLVLACIRTEPVHLVEPRKRRADFLNRAVEELHLCDHTFVWPTAVEKLRLDPVAAITARAVASLGALFVAAHHLSTSMTRWVLPKGRSAQSELDTARRTWQGDFELAPSATDPDSRIVIASGVRRRRGT